MNIFPLEVDVYQPDQSDSAKLSYEMIEISRKTCYATNGKLKRISLPHKNQL